MKKEPEVNFKLSSGSLDENIKQNDSLYPNIDLIEKKTIQSLGRSEIKTSLKTSQELDPSTISSKVIDFHVEKIDSMPLSFNQVKIFVTIDESSTVNDQKALCLRFKKYSRFSNIVICLYSKKYNRGKEWHVVTSLQVWSHEIRTLGFVCIHIMLSKENTLMKIQEDTLIPTKKISF